MKVREGHIDFKGLKTYYRIAGECKNGKKPLLILHGGPGSTHNSFEVLDSLAEDGRALIMYDQIGCGLSPAPGRTELFNRETWVEELITLRKELNIEECHLMGQSWGGMLLLEYVCHYAPEGLKSLILSSTLPSSRLWGEEQHRMIRELPKEMQEAIEKAEKTGVYDSPEAKAAEAEYMIRHCNPVWTEKDPECLTRKKNRGDEAYVTGWGPNEYTPLGNLKDFDVISELKNIDQPTLITSGTNDLSTPYINKVMHDEIKGSRWELFRYSRHMAYAEENEKYIALLREWLNEHNN